MILQQLLLLLLLLVQRPPRCSAGLPMFWSESDESDGPVLRSGQVWHASGSATRLTAVTAGQLLAASYTVVDVSHPERPQMTVASAHLLYKCNVDNPGPYNGVTLWNPTMAMRGQPATNGTLCKCGIQFRLISVTDQRFTLLFVGNAFEPRHALRQSLELRLRVTMPHRAVMDSLSLFVFNVDAIANMHSYPSSRHGFSYQNRVLTHEAVEVMLGVREVGQDTGLVKLKFLSRNFTSAFRAASELMKSLLSITVTLSRVTPTSQRLCSSGRNLSEDMMIFSSGDPVTLLESQGSAAQVLGHINMETGYLLFQNHVLRLLSAFPRFSLCLRVAFNTDSWSASGINRQIAVFAPWRGARIKTPPQRPELDQSCQSNAGPLSPHATGNPAKRLMYQGFQGVVLASPLVCLRRQDELEPVAAMMSGRLCLSIWDVAEPSDPRPKCGRAEVYRVLRDSVLRFPDELDARLHSGLIVFSAQSRSVQLNFSVAALPTFATRTHWSGLTRISRVRRFQPLTLRCGAFGANRATDTVFLSVKFRVSDPTGSWADHSLGDFAKFHLGMPHDAIATRTAVDELVSVLSIDLPSIERWAPENMFAVSLVCRARADRPDCELIGVSNFESRQHTVLMFTGFPYVDEDYIRRSRLRGGASGGVSGASALLLLVATLARCLVGAVWTAAL